MSIRICIDISRLADKPLTGVGKYIKNLVNHLSLVDAQNDYFLSANFFQCFHNSPKEVAKELRVGLNFRFVNLTPESVNISTFEKFDVVHSPNITSPKFKRAKLVTTVHDLSYFVNPEWHTKGNLEFSIRETRNAVKNAKKIVVPSENTLKDLLKYFGSNSGLKERVKVIPEAPDPIFYPERDYDRIVSTLDRFGIYSDYVLGAFTIEPRKNVKRLLRAYDSALSSIKEDVYLVLTGKVGWKVNLDDYLRELKCKDKIIFTGYVSDEELRVFYTCCKAFVYPSLYEGFGLPVVEAMACGAPVITSNVSSLPEIVGDSGITVNPYNVDEIAEAIVSVLEDDGLRKRLKKKGNKRVRRNFSWEKTARKTLEVYEELSGC